MSNHRVQINKAFDEKVLGSIDKTKRATALAVYGKLIETTPVDTSRARSNWWMDINIASTVVRDADNASSGGSQSLKVSQSETLLADTIYITNNLPYIRRLDEGYSQQAPAGMVAQSVQYGKERGKEFAKRIR